jgi:anti-anti-sigma factor
VTALEVEPIVSGDAAWLRVEGEVDMSTAADLAEAISTAERQGPDLVGLEMSGVDFLDATGVHLLIAANRRARLARRRFVISEPGYAVRRILAITGLDQQLEIWR